MKIAEPAVKPPLDPGFQPAILFENAYRAAVADAGASESLDLVVARPDGAAWAERLELLPGAERDSDTWRFLERRVKFLLWQKGGSRLHVAGSPVWAERLRSCYSPEGDRAFDAAFMGGRIFAGPFEVIAGDRTDSPQEGEHSVELGGHLDGNRIGFDLGGSDRKSAAVIDGEVVFSEEIAWDPYFQSDPEYHREGIRDSLRRAAAHLPRVDAIGGSAAGVYINNEVRAGSLFRGLSEDAFNRSIRGFFQELEQEWGVPVAIANDGEVAALASSLSTHKAGILGLSLGTSTAAGYVRPSGKLTVWLNELAFVPIDYREDAPVDEWSGDRGCGAQYFSQQAVARLAPAAGMVPGSGEKAPDLLVRVQKAMEAGDAHARAIYETIGVYLGYALLHWCEQYDLNYLQLLGRVMSGPGGDLIWETAGTVFAAENPKIGDRLNFLEVDERTKRHGQAIAAASLPALAGNHQP